MVVTTVRLDYIKSVYFPGRIPCDEISSDTPFYAHMGDKTVKMGNITVTHGTEKVETTIQGRSIASALMITRICLLT
jgi:hypothetical protein